MTPRETLFDLAISRIGTSRRRRLAGQGGRAVLLGLGFLLGLATLLAREFPPVVPPPKPAVLPSPSLRVLPNGLKVVVIERHTLPLLTLRLVVKAGAEADPADLPGTAQLVAMLLTEGTTQRSAQQIAESIDRVGGIVGSGAEWDHSFAALSVLTDYTQLAFDLLADISLHPSFAPAEVERRRKQTLSALEAVRDDPAYIADEVFRWTVFTGTPYSHPEDGTVEAVRRLTARDLRDFHARYYRPSNSILAAVGDISTDQAFHLAEKYFGNWNEGPRVPSSPGMSISAAPKRVVIIDRPDAVQTEIRVGNLGIRRDNADYYALTLANQILGGPATNRLFKALRSQQGLTYSASSDLVCYQTLGSWVAKTFTRTAETVKSVELVLEQMTHLRDHAISDQELEGAKSYLIGHQALEFESSEDVAKQVLELMVHNLPLDYWNRFPEQIRSLQPEDVWRTTRRYLDPERNVIVLVGNAAGFGKDVKKLGPVRVIPLRSLDFASAELEPSGSAAGNH